MLVRRAEYWVSAISSRLNLIRSGHAQGVSLGYLDRSGCVLMDEPRAALKWIFPAVDGSMIDHALLQAQSSVDAAQLDEGSSVRPASERWNIEPLTAELLAAVVILLNPRHIVEVGVANGTSTRVMLSALEVVGDGRLLSFDIDPRCANVVSSRLAHRWDFQLLPTGQVASLVELERQVMGMTATDLWFSDADHSFAWQKAEWTIALRALRPGGILIADDVDATPAWPIATHGWDVAGLVDRRKVTGAARMHRDAGAPA